MGSPRNSAAKSARAFCLFLLLLLLSMPIALSQTIGLQPESSLSFIHDPAGLAQQKFHADLRFSLSLSLANISLDVDYVVEGNLMVVSLRGIDDLR